MTEGEVFDSDFELVEAYAYDDSISYADILIIGWGVMEEVMMARGVLDE